MVEAALVEKTVQRLTLRKPARFQINALTKVGRKQLQQVLTEFFTQENLDRTHVLPIHYAIVEVVFNALKANVKFVAFREEIRKQLNRFKISEIEDLLQVIIEERTLREFMAPQVNKIFDLEEKYRAGMGQKLSAEQIELITRFRMLIRSIDAEVVLVIQPSADLITITVKNNVPMLGRDLERIENSRRYHQKLHNEGRAGEFFDYDNIDTTESAGFGIAMVDQGFYRFGLNPFEQMRIESRNRETLVTLSYPRRVLEKKPATA